MSGWVLIYMVDAILWSRHIQKFGNQGSMQLEHSRFLDIVLFNIIT